MIAADEDPHDVKVHIRGSHKNLGEVAPRRFLQVLSGAGSRARRQQAVSDLAHWWPPPRTRSPRA